MAEGDELPVLDRNAPSCRYLRSRGMYLYGDVSEDPEASTYWCLKTQRSFGVDDEHVNARDCRLPSRSCFESI